MLSLCFIGDCLTVEINVIYVTELESKWIELIVGQSLECASGDRVIVEAFNIPGHLLHRVCARINKMGAHSVVWPKTWANLVELVNRGPDELIQGLAATELESLKKSHKFLSIRAATPNDLHGISQDGWRRWTKHWLGPVHYQYRVNQMQWCSARWPHRTLAEASGIPDLEADYYAACVSVDPERLRQSAEAAIEIIPPAAAVRVVGQDTDLQFKLISTPWVKHFGKRNLPDGEIFSAPEIGSVNGHLTAKGPISFMGMELKFLWLEFDNGKVTNARTNEPFCSRLDSLLKIDAGSLYTGEFGIGLNHRIRTRIGDSMWDEKAMGTFHIALGNSYAIADNGNRSLIHWDIVVELNDKEIQVNGKRILPLWIS